MSSRYSPSISSIALAAALGSALSGNVSAQLDKGAAGQEKCFGVAVAGSNDCSSGPGSSCAGTSKTSYHGADWKMVPAGTCKKIKSPSSRTGFGQRSAFTMAKPNPKPKSKG